MNDIVPAFKATIDYIKGLIIENELEDVLDEKLNEQIENLVELEKIIIQYEKDISLFDFEEKINSDVTLENLLIIHTFITDFEWHLSEICELKDEVIEICSSKRNNI